jgi:hypothetical protein
MFSHNNGFPRITSFPFSLPLRVCFGSAIALLLPASSRHSLIDHERSWREWLLPSLESQPWQESRLSLEKQP